MAWRAHFIGEICRNILSLLLQVPEPLTLVSQGGIMNCIARKNLMIGW